MFRAFGPAELAHFDTLTVEAQRAIDLLQDFLEMPESDKC